MKVANDVVISTATKRIHAIQKHVTNAKTEIAINGEVMKPAAIAAVFQHCLDTRAAVAAKHGEYKAALDARSIAEAKRLSIDDGLEDWVLNRFGKNSPEALEFGYSPRKVSTPAVATKARAQLLSKATRIARGTMGRKAKKQIKGTLVAPTEPAAPAVIAPTPVETGGGGAVNGVAHS